MTGDVGVSTVRSRPGDVEEQAAALQEAMRDLEQRASAALRARSLFGRRVSSPELRKVLDSVPEATGELSRRLQRRVASGEPLDDTTVARLGDLLTTDLARIDHDSAWQLLEGLQVAFLAVGGNDPSYIRSLLDVEASLEARGDRWEEPWPYYGWGRVRWSQVLPVDDLADGVARYASLDTSPGDPGNRLDEAPPAERRGSSSPATPGAAVEQLNHLFRARVEDGRNRRARSALRNRYLRYAAAGLALLVGVLMAVVVPASDHEVTWAMSALVAVSGAVAGTLSWVFRGQEHVGITELRQFGVALVLQAVVGAAAALFVSLILVSGIIELPGLDPSDPSWAGLSAYGFAAGFSEPFWLKFVGRLGLVLDQRSPDTDSPAA